MTMEQMKVIEELKPLLLTVARKSMELGQYISITAFSETMASLTTDNYDLVLAPDFMAAGYRVPGDAKSRETLYREPNPLCDAAQEKAL